MHIDSKHIKRLSDIVTNYRDEVRERFRALLADAVGIFVPPVLSSFIARCDAVRQEIDGRIPSGGEISDQYRPLIRAAVAARRRDVARDTERCQAMVIHKDLLDLLDSKLEPYDEIMGLAELSVSTSERPPRLSDFFPIGVLEKSRERQVLPDRMYEDKFRILQAASVFLRDLEWTREASELRDVTFAVAYIDVDKFGDLNSKYGEPRIDRVVLPTLMRRIEAHTFMRGQAYRIGGDEFCIILNNINQDAALDYLDSLRVSIANLALLSRCQRAEPLLCGVQHRTVAVRARSEIHERSALF